MSCAKVLALWGYDEVYMMLHYPQFISLPNFPFTIIILIPNNSNHDLFPLQKKILYFFR